jgi:hypothetical protein
MALPDARKAAVLGCSGRAFSQVNVILHVSSFSQWDGDNGFGALPQSRAKFQFSAKF